MKKLTIIMLFGLLLNLIGSWCLATSFTIDKGGTSFNINLDDKGETIDASYPAKFNPVLLNIGMYSLIFGFILQGFSIFLIESKRKE